MHCGRQRRRVRSLPFPPPLPPCPPIRKEGKRKEEKRRRGQPVPPDAQPDRHPRTLLWSLSTLPHSLSQVTRHLSLRIATREIGLGLVPDRYFVGSGTSGFSSLRRRSSSTDVSDELRTGDRSPTPKTAPVPKPKNQSAPPKTNCLRQSSCLQTGPFCGPVSKTVFWFGAGRFSLGPAGTFRGRPAER